MSKQGDGAMEALFSGDQELRLLVETLPALVWRAGPEGDIEYVNKRGLEYLGATLVEIAGGGWMERVHPDDFPETASAFHHAIQTGALHQGVLRLRRADGEFLWHHVRCEPQRDRQGRIIQWYGLAVDIDETKKAEEQPRSAAQLQATLNAIPAYAWYTAPSGGLTFVNKRTADYLGLPKDHPLRFGIDIGAPWDAHIPLLHPDEREESRKAWSDCLRTGKAAEFTQRVPNAEGAYRWFLSRAEPLRASDGTLLQWVGVNLDIEELKCAEQALRDSECKLRQIFETVPGLLWSLDPTGEPTQLNKRLLDYSGMRLEEFKHGGWEAFLHPDDFPATAKAFYQAIESGTSHQAVSRLRRADGEYRWHHTRGEPLRDEQGRIIQWYGLSVDIDEAKKAEDRLRRSEAHLAEAQRLSHTGASAYNATTILYWSEETYRIFGFDPRDGLPSREAVWQRIYPDDRDRVRADVERAQNGMDSFSSEFRIVLPDGTVKYLESIRQPVFSTNGELVEVVATQIDVTERKRVEERLRVQHMVAQILAEAVTIEEATLRILRAMGECLGWDVGALWRVDRKAGALRFVELWHKTPIEVPEFERVSRESIFVPGLGLPGRVWSSLEPVYVPDVVPDENFPRASVADREELHAALAFPILLGGEALGVIEFFSREIRQPDQELLNVLATIGSQIGQFIERKRAEEALRESERSARAAIDGIAGLVSVLAPNGELETANRQLLEYFGRSLEWAKDWGVNDAVHPDDLPHVVDFFKRAIASGLPFNHELRLRRFDGEYRWFDNRGVPIRDDSGRIARWYILLTDIEDRVRALARLEQMQSDFAHMNRVSVMGELAATLAHEITQPIAAARNNARAATHFLDRNPPDLVEIRDALASIVDDADRAGDIIDRIRDQVKKAPPRKVGFDLNEAINEVVLLARSAVTKNGVSVQSRLADGLFPVEGDRVQLQQVVLNLILNAVEAMSTIEAGPRELLISTEQTQTGGVLVSVRDTGPGIDPDRLDRVFESFYSTKSSGVGMGLSICRSIIDAHGGRLWADANVPHGAIFQFTLPGAETELKNPLPAPQLTGEPHEDTVSAAAHQTAYEGNKRSHRSWRGPGQRRRDRQ